MRPATMPSSLERIVLLSPLCPQGTWATGCSGSCRRVPFAVIRSCCRAIRAWPGIRSHAQAAACVEHVELVAGETDAHHIALAERRRAARLHANGEQSVRQLQVAGGIAARAL